MRNITPRNYYHQDKKCPKCGRQFHSTLIKPCEFCREYKPCYRCGTISKGMFCKDCDENHESECTRIIGERAIRSPF